MVGELNEETYPFMNRIFCAECGYPLMRRVYSSGNRVCLDCSGQKRFTKKFCNGVHVPDSIIRGWGEITGNIYIRKEVDSLGKAEFKKVRESKWKKDHRVRKHRNEAPELTEGNYPYKGRIFCAECGYHLTRHVQTGNLHVFWVCSGNKHKGKGFCRGVRVLDEVVRDWGDFKGNIFIRKKVGKNGKTGYSYSGNKDKAD